MGFADALVLLNIRYDSEEAVKLAESVARFLTERARQASQELAEIRGCFPNWIGSLWDTNYHRPMRNAACTTIAPTGSISILASCSSGIEPIFSVVTRRRILGREFLEISPLVQRLGKKEGWLTRHVRAALLKGVPPSEIRGFPRRLAEVLVTAHEVSPEWHVRVQAAFQKHIDNAVSKTVNLPASATVADVDKVFRLAHELGCKGITVYREGSYEAQTLTAAGSAIRRPDPGCPCEPSGDGTDFEKCKLRRE
jgi:ribonucleoside-diphosphate reductase alpha chain